MNRCDCCNRRRRLSPYTLSSGAVTVVLALCLECAGPINALMAAGRMEPGPVKAHIVRPVTHAVVPVD